MSSINFPYYSYPNAPCGGYTNGEQYNQDVIKLNDKLEELNYLISDNVLLHISIGAPFEEIFTENSNQEIKTKFWFQYQQLIPNHIKRYTETFPHHKVYNIIISPNYNFEDDQIQKIKPHFIEKSNDIYNWNKINSKHYISEKYNIETLIYCCPMPSVDPKNKEIYLRLKELEKTHSFCDAEKLLQTEFDKVFIARFYSNLSLLFDKINSYHGFITVYSYAVFNQDTAFSRICRYSMFHEILSLFTGSPRNRVLGEWIFRHGFYSVLPFIKFSTDVDTICYCDYKSLDNLPENTEIKYLDYYANEFRLNKIKLNNEINKTNKPKNSNKLDIVKKNLEKYNYAKNNIYHDFNYEDFNLIKINPDGDCLFNAVIQGLRLDINTKIIREKVVEYIKNNFTNEEIFSTININNFSVNNFLTEYRMSDKDFVELYLKTMGMKACESINIRDYFKLPFEFVFGGYLEIIAICELFKTKINIVRDSKIIAVLEPINSNFNKEIYLDYAYNHYNLLSREYSYNGRITRKNKNKNSYS